MAFGCEWMNSDHDGPVRSRVGSIPAGAEDLPDGRRGEFVTELCEFAVDPSVFPSGVLVGDADDQTSEFGVDRWASAFGGGWLCPVPCDKSTMPPQQGFGPDDQERRRPARAIHGVAEEGKERAVGFVESWTAGLALQHEDLVSERKDLGISGVAGCKDPPDSSGNEARERGKQVHETSTIPTSSITSNPQDQRADDFSARTG